MKKDIHPASYRTVVFKDISTDYSFLSKSTAPSKENVLWEDGNEYPLVKLEISSASHPFFTGKMAFVDMQDISFKEYSFVNQPADQRSGVRGSKSVEGKAPVSDSENWVARSSAFVMHMDNDDIVSINENESM